MGLETMVKTVDLVWFGFLMVYVIGWGCEILEVENREYYEDPKDKVCWWNGVEED